MSFPLDKRGPLFRSKKKKPDYLHKFYHGVLCLQFYIQKIHKTSFVQRQRRQSGNVISEQRVTVVLTDKPHWRWKAQSHSTAEDLKTKRFAIIQTGADVTKEA